MDIPPTLPPTRRSGWLLLELLAGLVLALLVLGSASLARLVEHRQRVLNRRRSLAYFLVRGMDAELPLSERPRNRPPTPLTGFHGIRVDAGLLDLSSLQRRDLASLVLQIRVRPEHQAVEIQGPGVHEERRVPRRPPEVSP